MRFYSSLQYTYTLKQVQKIIPLLSQKSNFVVESKVKTAALHTQTQTQKNITKTCEHTELKASLVEVRRHLFTVQVRRDCTLSFQAIQ